MYQDEFQVFDLLDRFNTLGPPAPEGVLALFNQQPSVARRVFAYGVTLLHRCVHNHPNRLDLVQIFLDSYPDAITKKDSEGYLPVHRALTSESNKTAELDLVKLLILKAPETILESTNADEFPLHLACQRCGESVVEFLVDCFPDVCHYIDRAGKFPLDFALSRNDVNVEVLSVLLKQYPILLSVLDDEGALPIHRILRKNHHRFDEIVDILIEYYPGALRFQDHYGRTPLLQACSDNNSLSQVYSLIRKWPEQVSTRAGVLFYETSFNGELLPSALVSKSCRLDRVQQWVALYPEVIRSPDLEGRLPIHYAAVSQSDEALDILQFLLDQEPSSVSNADNAGRLPLHFSAASSCDDSLSQLLINAYPEGLQHADNDGRLPWHYGDCSRKSFIFDRTVEFCPDSETDLDMVPEEIRWDIVQIISEDG